MMVLHFKTQGQRLELTTAKRPVAKSKRGYLHCVFDLDSEWDGAVVAVSFFEKSGVEHAVLLDSERECPVPDEVTDDNLFRVSLTGNVEGHKITTNKVTVIQEVI